MMTNNARHALVWLLTVHSAARTSSRTHHRNPGLDIRAIFEEGRENAKFSWHVMARARVFQPRSGKCFTGSWRSTRWGTLGLGHERADAPRPFEATWRARKSTTSATGIAVSAALCARPGRALLSAGRPKHTDQGRTNRHARASPLPQLHMRKGVNRNPSRRPGLAVSDSNLHAVKTGHSESAAFPGYTTKCPGGK